MLSLCLEWSDGYIYDSMQQGSTRSTHTHTSSSSSSSSACDALLLPRLDTLLTGALSNYRGWGWGGVLSQQYKQNVATF